MKRLCVRVFFLFCSADCVWCFFSHSLVFIRVHIMIAPFFCFVLSLIVCVCFASLSPSNLAHNSALLNRYRRVVSGVSTGYPPVFQKWTECEI